MEAEGHEDVDESRTEYSQREIFISFYAIKAMIICVIPAAALIYRHRILSLHAFVVIKKHQGRRKGIAYSKCL